MLRRVQQRMKKTAEEIRENLSDLKVSPIRNSDIILVVVLSPSRDFARDFANALAEEYLNFRAEDRARASESALLMLTRTTSQLSQEVKAAQDRYISYAKEHNLPMLRDSANSWWQTYYITLTENARLKSDLAFSKAKLAALEKSNSAEFLALVNQGEQLQQNKAKLFAAAQGVAPNQNTPDQNALPGQTVDASAQASNLQAAAVYQQLAVGTSFPAPDALGLSQSTVPSPNGLTPGAGDNAAPNPAALGSADIQRTIAQNAAAGMLANQSVASMVPSLPNLPNALIQSLINLELNRVSLEARVEDLTRQFKPLHPALIAARQDLEDTRQKIQIQMNFAREVTRAEVASLEQQVTDSNLRLQESQAQSFEKSRLVLDGSSYYDDLERLRSQYNALLSQLTKLDISHDFSYRTISILERAMVDPDPVYPKKVKGLLIAAFFGLGLGLALAFFIEYIDDSIKLAEEVERDLQLPFLGMIPAAQWSPDDLTAHRLDKLKQQGGVAESYRVVRSAIIFSIPREKLRSILLTSAVPREGKTTTCVNLSIGFAQIEDRVLLIDGDLRRGEIHKYFGLEREKGLADILLGEATPEEVIKHSSVPKLDLITSGTYPANPAELLLGWRLKELLDWAYKHYDRVIVDCTPVMGIADSAILGAAVDGVLFVIWAGRTSRRYVRVAKMTAVSRGAKIFGFVLNNLEPGRVGYYHYYPYYYSYYSRGYYYAHQEEEAGKGGDVKGIEVPTQKDGKDEIDDVY
jgi:capsular exopolysaccharide synthesis family protein